MRLVFGFSAFFPERHSGTVLTQAWGNCFWRGGFAIAWVLFILLSVKTPGQAANSGGLAGEIFTFGAGARALGMGSAHTAMVQDVTALYYNPAGLGLLNAREVTFMRAELFEGASYDYIGYAQHKKKRPGGWGIELIRLGVDDADGRDEFNNPTGSFGFSELAFGVAHGWRGLFHPKLSLGVKGKMLNRSLGGASDRLFGLDVGAQSGPWMDERLTLGAVAQNLIHFSQGDTDDSLKVQVRAGASYRLIGPLVLAADISEAGEFRLGTEYVWGIASFRLGMSDQALAFGGGFRYKNRYAFDVALTNHPELGMSQRFSIGYRFGSKTASAPLKRAEPMKHYASEYFNNGIAELKSRKYIKASRSIETAIGIDADVGGPAWRIKSERLRKAIKALELDAHEDDQKALAEDGPSAFLAYAAVSAYLDNEADRASVLAHAALGAEPRSPTYGRFLNAMTRLSGRKRKRDEILPPARLADLKMRAAVQSVYRRQFGVAVDLLREALWLDPNNATAWTRLGSAYFAMGDKKRASSAYRKALELNPGDGRLRRFMQTQGL